MDQERLRDAEVSESVHRHFTEWLSELLHGTARAHDTERFLPLLNQQGIDLDNLVVALFTLDGAGGPLPPPVRPSRFDPCSCNGGSRRMGGLISLKHTKEKTQNKRRDMEL